MLNPLMPQHDDYSWKASVGPTWGNDRRPQFQSPIGNDFGKKSFPRYQVKAECSSQNGAHTSAESVVTPATLWEVS
jgi:hypothetical protein